MRQAVARPRYRQSVCIHNIHVAATCRPSVLGSATKTRPHVVEQSGQCGLSVSPLADGGRDSHPAAGAVLKGQPRARTQEAPRHHRLERAQ